MAAIYAADIFCDDCADSIRKRIAREIWDEGEGAVLPDGTVLRELAGEAGCPGLFYSSDLDEYLRGMDERTYDSGDYPKWCSDDINATA